MKKFGDVPDHALTKLTEASSVSFVSAESPVPANFLSQESSHHSAAWAENFHRWMLEKCAFNIRSFGGIDALYRDFREWSTSREEVPCSRQSFDELLAGAGLFRANGLVSGLILRSDLEATKQPKVAQKKPRSTRKN